MDDLLHSKSHASALISPLVLILAALFAILWAEAPAEGRLSASDLLLAKVYKEHIDPGDYWVSEKLDGVRAFWDGRRLISRNGYPFRAPRWFTRGFPEVPLDGELWMGRNTYEALSAAVRRREPVEAEWRKIGFWVFDLPAARVNFTRRYEQLGSIVAATASPYLSLVEQYRVADKQALMKKLDTVVRNGGEGLMLHRAGSLYRSGRSDDLLKLKPFQDAEAVVIAHNPGKGKYAGQMGSVLVETEVGKRFYIGSGFSDEQRRNPPPPGTVITYKYYGLTSNGIPRFASFLRVCDQP